MQTAGPTPEEDCIRLRLAVRGVVQGVGFRPYVYNLAQRHGLSGFVMNSPEGALLEVQGASAVLEAFLQALPSEAPPLARISEVSRMVVPVEAGDGFEILGSQAAENAFTLVPPDVAVCAACLADTRDPGNRRFDYPFTNCTHCGPRYSIIVDIPYDRSRTTMAGFALCAACRDEYQDPQNRRFHAQPNACPVCGPRLQLVVPGRQAAAHDPRDILTEAASILRGGGIVAWKGLGGYQLACDARQQAAVEQLRRRKHRNDKPFALMVEDTAAAAALCFLSEAERAALEGPERPIVLLRARPGAGVAPAVAPHSPWLGIMLPCTPMHDLLFRILRETGVAGATLVMTSGNLSEEPIVIDESAAERELGAIADGFVHHNRPIHTRVDDSIVRVVEGVPVLLRRARGYAPRPIPLGLGEVDVLACGAQQKSTFCLTRAGLALLSQHLGDLENYETLRFYEETLERMQRLFHAHPRAVAHDLHPGYLSTQLALKLESERKVEQRIAVQHHHAHIASCMAEHQLRGRVIGVAWDGTGLGSDGTIWGGEFLTASLTGFERCAHLRTVLLAGGDAAVREPWRVARAYLRDAFGPEIPAGLEPAGVAAERVRLVDRMLDQRLNSFETSSAGRLFDAVAALIGLRQVVSFEGQAAMALEALATGGTQARPYDFEISTQTPVQLDLRPTVRGIAADIERKVAPALMASRFHQTLVTAITQICRRMREDGGLERVCLSGGCFQNLVLLSGCVASLRSAGFEVFFQQQVPCNDGGTALGQAAIACSLLRRGQENVSGDSRQGG